MSIPKLIRQLSILPPRYNSMIENALRMVKDKEEKTDLCTTACAIASATWQHWQAWRQQEDNRKEHEWIVFANFMRIAKTAKLKGRGLSLSQKRVGTAVAFTHDTFKIHRIMETDIKKLRKKAKSTPKFAKELTKLEKEKKSQRDKHMKGGADNAEFLLRRLKKPFNPLKSLLTTKEIKRCVKIVKTHDKCKKGILHPPGNDLLAVVCFEADVLWPLHPIGVLADLERPKKRKTADFNSPEEWKKKVIESIQSIVDYKKKWKVSSFEKKLIKNPNLVFRTNEGYKMYLEWKGFWGIKETDLQL